MMIRSSFERLLKVVLVSAQFQLKNVCSLIFICGRYNLINISVYFFYPLLGSSMLAKYILNFWVYIFVIWSGLKNRHKICGMDHMIFAIKSSQKR